MNFSENGVVHLHRERAGEYTGPIADMRHVCAEDCTCNLQLYITASQCTVQRLFCAERFVAGKRQTLESMWCSLRTQLSATYRIVEGVVKINDYSTNYQSAVSAIHTLPLQNCVRIPPVSLHATPASNKKLYPHKDLVLAYKQWDYHWLRRYVPDLSIKELVDKVWMEVKYGHEVYNQGISWSHSERAAVEGVPSLRTLALRKVSAFNRALGGNELGPHAIYTLQDAYPKKKVKEIKKYNRPTHIGSQMSGVLAGSMFNALTMMYKCTGWNLMKKGREYKWSAEKSADHHVPLTSSAGFRPGPRIEVDVNSAHRIVYHTLGKKREQIQYGRKYFAEFMQRLMEEPQLLDEPYYINTDKEEILGSEDKAEFTKLTEKLRQFNIPTITAHLAAVECNSLRHAVERGNHILIGHKWSDGGAYHIAKFLRYEDLDAIIDGADFSRYDKSISKWMLELSTSMASYYYDDGGDIEVYLRLVEAVASNISVKVINLLERIWVLMIGVMPSGAYETSHTDSWINLMLFYLFCETKMATMPPKQAKRMRRDMLANIVTFVVYGDDHLCRYPSRYYKWINVHERKKWLFKYCNMTLRDCEVYRSYDGIPALITVVDPLTGQMIKKGPVFLQHYFIARECVSSELKDLPPVLPYRTTFKTFYKFPFGSGAPREPVDYVMASIGHAYDTRGTNPVTYDFCRFMHTFWIRKMANPQKELRTAIARGGMSKTITKLYRKAGIPVECLLDGFPTMAQLQAKNVYDSEAHINVAKIQFLNEMQMRNLDS